MGVVCDCVCELFDGGLSAWREWVEVGGKAVAGASCVVWNVCWGDVGGFYAVSDVGCSTFFDEHMC